MREARLGIVAGEPVLTSEVMRFLRLDPGLRDAREIRVLDPQAPGSFAGLDLILRVDPPRPEDPRGELSRDGSPWIVDLHAPLDRSSGGTLLIPRVNPHRLPRESRWILVPDPFTTQLALTLMPYHEVFRVTWIRLRSFLAASQDPPPDPVGARARAYRILERTDVIDQVTSVPGRPVPAASRVTSRLQELLEDPELSFAFDGEPGGGTPLDCQEITLEVELPLSEEKARKQLALSPGLHVEDEADSHLPFGERIRREPDLVFVGRVWKQDPLANVLKVRSVAPPLATVRARVAVEAAALALGSAGLTIHPPGRSPLQDQVVSGSCRSR